jgi:hypothetical protein
MKSKLITAVIFGSLAISGFAQPERAQTFTGVVSDNMCGKQHMAKDKSAAQCTRECVKTGSDYALVVGDKVYTLKSNKSDIDRYAGEKVNVTGTAKDETITVIPFRHRRNNYVHIGSEHR